MAGMMEPVGPEGPRTYWIRRAIVGGVIVVVLIVIVALVAALSGGNKGNTAEPPPPTGPSLQPAGTPTPTASPSASDDSPEPSPSATTSDKPDPSAKKSTEPSASGKPDKSNKPSESSKPSPKTSSTRPPVKPADCKPADLRTTLTGPRIIEPGKKVTFQAGVINGGTTACTFTLDPKTYVFRVYSGSDKIWTTADCTKRLPKVETTLEPQDDVTWKVEWSVQRSKGCDLVDTDLKPGTYAANSLLEGAKPAQLVMQLK